MAVKQGCANTGALGTGHPALSSRGGLLGRRKADLVTSREEEGSGTIYLHLIEFKIETNCDQKY